ncbi:MAG: acetylxylan esterase, partial [Planctomycetota bacterium]|nr:acetylxylan esterase [Planctomycetota bacterium]
MFGRRFVLVVTAVVLLQFIPCRTALSQPAKAQPKDSRSTEVGDRMIAEYFRHQTNTLTRQSLSDIKTKQDWLDRKDEYRRQLFEMLSLDPLPERTPLKPVTTGKVEHDAFTVENVHFQSRPGLFVTGNLYVPKQLKGKAPAILYVCGHGRVKKNGISYGNKTHYQHHGSWFARNGYVCLTIDTLQLGEIEGIHHGTYNHGMFWWNSRGYSSAGVEAWNCIRALDYLETRPEVDRSRFGVTGRSGGGAYSWWIAALDERIKVAVPVAGITSLANHVVDGCVEGHCDCMYQVNTYRWDYPMIAALVAPRPLLISNTDKDRIFPLDGVVDVYVKTRRIYELLGQTKHIGLQITEGPHKDTQELRIHAFHWFNRFLKGQDPSPLIETAAVKFFEPEQLKVFDKLPEQELNTKIQDTFTARYHEILPESPDAWKSMRTDWMQMLRAKSFRGWLSDADVGSLDLKQAFSAEHDGVQLSAYDFRSEDHINLRLFLAHRAGLKRTELDLVVLNAVDDQGWSEFASMMSVGFKQQLGEFAGSPDPDGFAQTQRMFKGTKWAMAYVAPRGIGPTEWNRDARKRVQFRRRFMLLGQTQDGTRV